MLMSFKILNKQQNSTNITNEATTSLSSVEAKSTSTIRYSITDPSVKGKISNLFKYLNEDTTNSNNLEVEDSLSNEEVIISAEDCKESILEAEAEELLEAEEEEQSKADLAEEALDQELLQEEEKTS